MKRSGLILFLVLFFASSGSAFQEGANPIDRHFEPVWREAAAPPADDAVFLRRVSLDLTGRLPTAGEIRAFLKSGNRAELVDALLNSHDAAVYHADLWFQWLFDYDFEVVDLYRVDFSTFHEWIRRQFSGDVSYADFVTALLADRGSRVDRPAVNFAIKHLRPGEPPVKLAVMSARLFLGRDIRCSQCHDAPFGKMTQEEFWGYVGFFRPLAQGGYGLEERDAAPTSGAVADHLGEMRTEARFLDGRTPEPGRPLGQELARFTLSAEGAAAPRALVERFWRLLLGRKIPAPLLDELTRDFEAGGGRIRRLLRRIVLSKAYQMSSAGTDEDREAHRSGPLKAMNLVQFMTAFSDAFDLHTSHEQMFQNALKDPKSLEIFKDRQVMRLFFHKWAKEMVLPKGSDPEATDPSGTVRLAMKLMNNTKIQSLISSAWGTLRKAMRQSGKAEERIEFLFLSLLGRMPTPRESEKFVSFVKEARDSDKAYEDVFWVLVNAPEFLFVH